MIKAVEIAIRGHKIPLPHNATWGNTQYHDHKLYWYPYCLHLKPRVESITDESLESNCSIIENIPPKGVSFSDLIATFAMSVGFDTYFDVQH